MKLIISLILFGCTIIQNQIFAQKITTTPYDPILLLIPNGYTARIGYLIFDNWFGINPYIASGSTLTLANYSIIESNRISSSGSIENWILNPSSIGGLPIEFKDYYFTGLAEYMGYNNIILSTTQSSNHYLVYATKTSNEYDVTSVQTVTASFAPASSGWVLCKIEYSNIHEKLYGLFKNGTNTILAEINLGSGVATSIFSTTLDYCGLDLSSVLNTSGDDACYLMNLNQPCSSGYGEIDIYDIPTSTISSYPLGVTTPFIGTGIINLHNAFLVQNPDPIGLSYGNYIFYYPSGNGIYYSPSIGTINLGSNTSYLLIDGTSIDNTINDIYVITDAAHF